MTEKKKPSEPVVLEMHNRPGMIKHCIQKRLDFVNKGLGFSDEQGLSVSECAFEAFESITGGNPAHALYTLRTIVDHLRIQRIRPPYKVTVRDIESKAIGRNEYAEIHRSGMHQAAVIHAMPWWER